MKHLLSIFIFLSFMSVASAKEQVYYCAMEHDTFLGSPSGKIITGYKDRFTASIDFENETFKSKDLWLTDAEASTCKLYTGYNEMLCVGNNGVQSISIRSDNLSYILSFVSIGVFEKGGDPVGISYGKCEVF